MEGWYTLEFGVFTYPKGYLFHAWFLQSGHRQIVDVVDTENIYHTFKRVTGIDPRKIWEE